MNRLPTWLEVLGATLIILLLIFLYLWQGWQVIYLQRRVSELEEELIPLRERKRELQITVARYFSYDRIERIAKERLGMVEPEITEEEASSE
ncbi:septum formation initiator family protein [Candidatus Bipolaricaulota bacterium]|nr:septum formation initiator family protein [Candidatus Bipolaricaulota bacterium]